MFVVPVNRNIVTISTVPSGCCRSTFDSTYPTELKNVVSEQEFQESIEKINQLKSPRIEMSICLTISLLCVIGGIILFIVGGTTSNPDSSSFPIFLGVGGGAIVIGFIVLIISLCVPSLIFLDRLEKLIAEESAKYAGRSPTPCTWELSTMKYAVGSRSNHRSGINRHIGNASQTSVAISVEKNNSSSYGQSVGRFCSQCGAPRTNTNAKFCSSCGLPFSTF